MLVRNLVPFLPAPSEALADTRGDLALAVARLAQAVFFILLLLGGVLAPLALLVWALRLILG